MSLSFPRRRNRSKPHTSQSSRPLGSSLERLEGRVFLHGGGFEANINFQKTTPAAPTGYFLDAGQTYGDRGNGLTYGWDADNTAAARDRNNTLSPDQRYDTLTHMQLYGTRTWEIAVPNGSYTVHVVGGDPSAADSTFGINVEGTLAVSGKNSSTQHWREGTVTVQVSDGRLTVSNAAGAVNNKINFIDIHAADVGPEMPTVGVGVSDGAAGEAGPNPGSFLVTRTGDTAAALTVNYALSGNATNGDDYARLGGSVVIPAGATSAVVTINPVDDSAVEGAEGVTLSLLASDAYDLSGTSSATIQIVDNDTGGGGTGFSAKVNFQPAGSAVPAGYSADTGLVFGDRGNGLSFGWNANNASYARDRNAASSPDQRYDTLNQMQRSGGGTVWELAVPNGTYTVHVVAGDPSAYDSTYAINVEGVLAVSGKPTSTVKWFEGTRTVTVTDGRLTVTNAAGSANNKIAFLDVFSDGGPVLPQVSITATDTSASEAGDLGTFVVTRTGSTTQSLLVNLTRGGSATNGVDYDTLGDNVLIPAGAASATFNVRPIQDSLSEGSETVTYAIAPGSGYAVASSSPAGVTIHDDDVSGTTLAWTDVAPIPVGRSEAMGAVVNGKLYLFGGYVDTTFTPTRRADVYDPATNSWRQIRDLPSFAYPGASHVGTTALGSSIYFAGGYPAKSTSGQTFATTAVFRYDTTTDTYASLPSLPSGRGGGALVALGRELHFFGGSDAARADSGSHWALNLDNLAAGWAARASLPVATNHVAGVVLGGKICSIGGQQLQDDAAVQRADVQVYDSATDRWTSRAPLPIARSHITSATFVRDGRILVLGGLKQGNVVMNTVSSYDPAANAWSSLTPLPSARLSGVSDVLPDGRIIFATGAGNGFRDTTWIGDFV